MPKKDFTQVAFDVLRQATHEEPRKPSPAPKPKKQAAPKKGAAKKAKKSA
jgi:hypothetical protein